MLWECVALIVMVFGVLFPLEPLWVSPLQSEPLMIPLNELLGELLTPCSDVLDHVPTREAVEHELPCEWFASSSVATDELAIHTHSGSISNTTLTGNTAGASDVGYYDSASGILGVNTSTNKIIGGNGSAYTVYRNLSINATHGHNISIGGTGSNAKHENRNPIK